MRCVDSACDGLDDVRGRIDVWLVLFPCSEELAVISVVVLLVHLVVGVAVLLVVAVVVYGMQ
jgi:hypothetical protein